jgi:hypothetical protein
MCSAEPVMLRGLRPARTALPASAREVVTNTQGAPSCRTSEFRPFKWIGYAALGCAVRFVHGMGTGHRIQYDRRCTVTNPHSPKRTIRPPVPHL